MRIAVLLVYFATPFLLLRTHRLWGAPAAVLALWIPVELGFFSSVGVPTIWAMATGMAAGILALRKRTDVIDVSAAFDLGRLDFQQAIVNFLLIAAIDIPVAMSVGFVRPAFQVPELPSLPITIGTIFLFALGEEILFRGIIQHSIENRLRSRGGALLIASLIFGAAHLNNGAAPNYRYFLVSGIAGVFYGRAWRRQRNVWTSTLTHTMVNAAWRLFFR